ncbi:hypothetical protein FOE78_23095 [Microlunatus elymi]|uniref:Uncharacterized protein n=1 Tax=Microlunatus elymi TaxID=2596828 RepID=A0A516Q4U9_9ACTN|nr:hypothetical protein [Microlunatus elymi]QDP98405.1 hypothetical protein FOE78_23095 [Microlunatus elymi]
MQLGSEVAVHGRRPGASAVGRIGVGRVVHPYVVQVDNDLAAAMCAVPHRAEHLEVFDLADGARYPIDRIRPGLIRPDQAAEILAAESPGLQLLPVQQDLVFLETAQPLISGRAAVADQPWWCRILCLKSCSGC